MQTSAHTTGASITIDLERLEANARTLTGRLPGVAFAAVTKSTCGSPEVARAMLAGGATAIADSRLANLARLRTAGIAAPLWLLRSPTPGQAAEAVIVADVSLESELETLAALDAAAHAAGRPHDVVVMVDLGDLREGVLPDDLPDFLEKTATFDNVRVAGIGVNLTCYGGVCPTPENLAQLVHLTAAAERQLGRRLVVSGGNSSTLWRALMGGGIPERIDNLRIGESILLGVETIDRRPIEGLHLDAFVIEAPVIECRVKPSLPIGETSQDAFGNTPVFVDRGLRRRAICALGRQDAPPDGLRPLDPGVEILGASSDHLICDVHDVEPAPRLGDRLRFIPNYACLVQAFTSPYVEKVFTPPA
jgi:ornithine racemase